MKKWPSTILGCSPSADGYKKSTWQMLLHGWTI